jgi:hypothetical protein
MSRAINTITAATAVDGATNLNIDSGTLFINTTANKVGISTTSPTELLEVGNESTSNNYIKVSAANNTASGIKFRSDSSLTIGYDIGYEGNGNHFFFKNDVGGTVTERMRIDGSGNVGIGTTSPSDILHVSKANGVSIFESPGVSSVGLRLRTNSTDRWQIGCPSASADLAIYTGAAAAERLRIDSSGNVGVGTNNPSVASGLGLVLNGGASQTRLAFKNTTTGDTSTDGVQFVLLSGQSGFVFQNRESDGSFSFETDNTERVRIASDGRILFAKNTAEVSTVGFRFDPNGESFFSSAASTSAGGTLYVYSTGAAAYRFYVGLGGTVNATNTAIAAISDVRLKENIRDIDAGLNKILELKPRTFDWKDGKGANTKNAHGFIAQEIEQVFPNLVDEWRDPAPEGEEPYKSVRQDLIPVLVKAIQELSAKVTALEAA